MLVCCVEMSWKVERRGHGSRVGIDGLDNEVGCQSLELLLIRILLRYNTQL
jgi:hypothetical protein